MTVGRGTLRFILLLSAVRSAYLLGRYVLGGAVVRRHTVESSLIIFASVSLIHLVLNARDRAPSPAQVSLRRHAAWLLPLTLLVTTLYWPTIHLGYLSDDFVLADWAKRAEFVGSSHGFVRPATLVLWRLVLSITHDPIGVHIVTVLLHIALSWFVLVLGVRLGLTSSNALLAAVLFAVWPTNVEAVAWASCLSETLMAAAVVSCVLLYERAPSTMSARSSAGIVCLMILAILAKETGIVIASLLLIVALPRWRVARPGPREAVTLATVWVVCAGYSWWRVVERVSAGPSPQPEFSRYVLKQQLSICFGNLGMPFAVEFIQRHPLVCTVFAVVVLCAIAVAALLPKPRTAILMLQGAAWALLGTLPALGYFFVGNHLEGSRYLYLPTVGWALLLGASVQTLAATALPARVARAVIIGCVVTTGVIQTRQLIGEWQGAAAQRDEILASARQITNDLQCSSPTFLDLPQTYKAAQLFTNGFGLAFGTVASQRESPRRCRLSWNGRQFVAVP